MHNYDAQQHRAGQIISPLTLQTITIARMLCVGGEVITKIGLGQNLNKNRSHNSGHTPFMGGLSPQARI